MWPDLVRFAAKYPPVAVLSAVEDGYPLSVRVTPELDEPVIRTGTTLDGPASLLFATHDATLTTMRAFLLRGRLSDGVFTPSKLIRGARFSPGAPDVAFFVSAKARAERYLEARALNPPDVPWDEIKRLIKETK